MKVICNKVNSDCMKIGCAHSIGHEDEFGCQSGSHCGEVNLMTECISVDFFKLNKMVESTALLTAEPREFTLEEIAVAAMVGLVFRTLWTAEATATKAYDIAEAMKAEKAKREKKNG